MKGRVKWFNDSKGYGFIENKVQDIFVHHADINVVGFKTLREGATVTFEVEKTEKGPVARKVTPLPEKPADAPKDKALYTFTWTSGGFNQVYAATKREAIKEIARRFPGSSLKPNLNSLKRLTKKQADAYWKNIPPLD